MKKLKKDIEKFTRGAVTLGVGTVVTARLATHAPSVSVTPAFGAAAGMMPMVGTTMMGAGMLRMVGRLKPRKRKRKKR